MDRTVHARVNGFEVVRYDRSGKWWVERSDGVRLRVDIHEAVGTALDAAAAGGEILFDRSGGGTFDRLVRKRLRA